MESSVRQEALCGAEGLPSCDTAEKELLYSGAWANAQLFRYRSGGEWFVLKSFQERSFFVRWTIGALLTWRELMALRRVAGLEGVPHSCRRVSYCALSMRCIEGEPLGNYSVRKQRLPESYFIAAEKVLERIHHRGLVHLDLRRGNNWFVSTDGQPVVIDFQSALGIACFPPALQKFLCEIDLSGLYKIWDRICEKPLDAERRDLLERINRRRRFWLLRGYAFKRVFSSRQNRKET